MFLTNTQLQQLLEFASLHDCPSSAFESGSVLQSKDRSNSILLIKSGWVRVLDPSKKFESFTISRFEAPYLCGLLSRYKPTDHEEVVASGLVEVVDMSGCINLEGFEDLINKIMLNSVSPSEISMIQQLVDDNCFSIPEDQQFIKIYLRRWRPIDESSCLANQSLDCIYADVPSQGFHHGQLFNTNLLNGVWKGSFPRLLYWSDGQVDSPIVSQAASDNSLVSAIPSLDSSSSPESVTEFSEPSRDPSLRELTRRLRRLGINPISAPTLPKAFEAVFAMLSDFHTLPTRRDTIKKATSYLLESSDGPSYEKLIQIFDRFGLIGRVVNSRLGDLSRLPTPAIYLNDSKSPIFIVEIVGSRYLCVDPFNGVQLLDPHTLASEHDSSLTVVTAVRGSSTPTSRFGLRWMLPYMSFYKVGLIEVFVASFITQLFALATPLLFQQIIDRVIGQGSSSALGGFAVLMGIFMILELIFSSLRTFQFMEISNRIDINIGSSIISRLLRLNARYFEKRPVGELASRLNELDKIRSFLTGTALTVVLDAFFALLYFGVMFFYSPLLAGIILASIPVLLILILGITPITQKLIRQRAEAHSRTHSYMVEILNGIQTVKLQNSELTARRNWESRHLDDINKGFKTVLANTVSSNGLQLINKTTNILVICFGAGLVLDNKLTLGQLIAFRIISGYVTQPILRLANTWNTFQEVSMSIERLGDVVNQPLETTEDEYSNISMPPIKGEVHFDEVSFSYSSSSTPQLSGVSLTIPPGSFTGLVGQSGCGKSTILKLVPRLYQPTQGKVLIDGYDVGKVELYSLRRQLGFVPQDCLLFEGTIYNNIAVADPEAEADQVIQAAQLACAHDFIMTLPNGYNTFLGEKGSGLSGGQRQRVALARMLLQKPKLVILDEATSALDVDTEQQVVSNLRRVLKDTTVLMITHRLSTLVNADKIVMMHNGRIDSSGTHQELMDLSGRYFAMYQQQLVS